MSEEKKTVKAICDYYGINAADLARASDVSWNAADKAMRGESLSSRSKRDIAKGLSQITGSTLHPGDIAW